MWNAVGKVFVQIGKWCLGNPDVLIQVVQEIVKASSEKKES